MTRTPTISDASMMPMRQRFVAKSRCASAGGGSPSVKHRTNRRSLPPGLSPSQGSSPDARENFDGDMLERARVRIIYPRLNLCTLRGLIIERPHDTRTHEVRGILDQQLFDGSLSFINFELRVRLQSPRRAAPYLGSHQGTLVPARSMRSIARTDRAVWMRSI